jgi:hypothetical protein
MVLLYLLRVKLKERALLPLGKLGCLDFHDGPELLEWLDVNLVLVDFRVLSRRIIQIDLHLVYLLHFVSKVSQLIIHHLDGLVVLIFESLGVILAELVELDLDLLEALSEYFLLGVKAVYDLLAIASQGLLLGLNVLVDIEDLVLGLLDLLDMLLQDLQPWVVKEEAQLVDQVVVLVDQLLPLKNL